MEAWPNSAVWILVTGYYGRGCGIFITAVKNKDTKKQANDMIQYPNEQYPKNKHKTNRT